MKTPMRKSLAASVASALILASPGLPCYQAFAQARSARVKNPLSPAAARPLAALALTRSSPRAADFRPARIALPPVLPDPGTALPSGHATRPVSGPSRSPVLPTENPLSPTVQRRPAPGAQPARPAERSAASRGMDAVRNEMDDVGAQARVLSEKARDRSLSGEGAAGIGIEADSLLRGGRLIRGADADLAAPAPASHGRPAAGLQRAKSPDAATRAAPAAVGAAPKADPGQRSERPGPVSRLAAGMTARPLISAGALVGSGATAGLLGGILFSTLSPLASAAWIAGGLLWAARAYGTGIGNPGWNELPKRRVLASVLGTSLGLLAAGFGIGGMLAWGAGFGLMFGPVAETVAPGTASGVLGGGLGMLGSGLAVMGGGLGMIGRGLHGLGTALGSLYGSLVGVAWLGLGTLGGIPLIFGSLGSSGVRPPDQGRAWLDRHTGRYETEASKLGKALELAMSSALGAAIKSGLPVNPLYRVEPSDGPGLYARSTGDDPERPGEELAVVFTDWSVRNLSPYLLAAKLASMWGRHLLMDKLPQSAEKTYAEGSLFVRVFMELTASTFDHWRGDLDQRAGQTFHGYQHAYWWAQGFRYDDVRQGPYFKRKIMGAEGDPAIYADARGRVTLFQRKDSIGDEKAAAGQAEFDLFVRNERAWLENRR